MDESLLKTSIIKVLKQRGRSNALRDRARYAQMPGKRVSASGKVYWETRRNRSDLLNDNT